MDSIITYLFLYNQYLLKIISQLLLFIAKYIPLKQWAFDDSHSPEYQKFKVDKLPKIIHFEKADYQLLLAYYKHKYSKLIKPVKRRKVKSIPENILCPRCGAPHQYIYDNNGNRGQFQCKVCGQNFNKSNHADKPMVFLCPYLFKEFPNKVLKFIADGCSAYPLAGQQCKLMNGWDFDVTQVIGLTNDDAVSTEFHWVKQVVERA